MKNLKLHKWFGLPGFILIIGFFIQLLFVPGTVKGQTGKSNIVVRPYSAFVYKLNGQPKANGILYDVNEEAILLSSLSDFKRTPPTATPDLRFNYQEIEQVKLRRRGKLGRGILCGFLIGAFAGVITGNLLDDDPEAIYFTPPEIIVAIPGAILGMITGAIVGNKTEKMPINGNLEHFQTWQDILKSHSYRGQVQRRPDQ